MESPTNPLLKVIDIAAVAKIIAKRNPEVSEKLCCTLCYLFIK